MLNRKKSPRIRWILLIFLLLTAVYLNRAYAYFYDFVDSHKILPISQNTVTQFKSQTVDSKILIKYVALGDSLTYGVGVEEEAQTFPFLIAKGLASTSNVELVNLGIPGARSDEVIKLELNKLEKLKPDLVTLLIGTNDTQSFQTENAFRKNYQTILDQLTLNSKTQVVILNIPPLNYNFLFPYKYLVDLRIKHFNSIIDNLVKEKRKSFSNIIFINLYGETKQKFLDDPTLYSKDYFHPGNKGYQLWSQIINANLNN